MLGVPSEIALINGCDADVFPIGRCEGGVEARANVVDPRQWMSLFRRDFHERPSILDSDGRGFKPISLSLVPFARVHAFLASVHGPDSVSVIVTPQSQYADLLPFLWRYPELFAGDAQSWII